MDSANSICYMVSTNQVEGMTVSCPSSSELIRFNNDAEIDGFVHLLTSGEIFIYS